jgi:two-component system, chemotaxis family, response regulator PixG
LSPLAQTDGPYCPDVNVEKIQLPSRYEKIDYWDYLVLETLHKKQKISCEQVNGVFDSTIAELLFDLAQQSNFTDMTCDRNQKVILESPMSLSSTDVSLRNTSILWHSWSEAGLANFSPNLAPILRQPEQLQQKISPVAYANFVKLMNGKYTLRDLAIKMKQNVISVSRSVLPYILRGIIELVEVPDLSLQISAAKNNSISTQANQTKAPLIACVDDSPQICQMLKTIINGNGMRLIDIQDPVNILPTLIEQKPDIILLDLIMPVVSGYEICSQLRRISAFANTPIVIITGSDGLFDRVRAKVVGSTDFMTKPVTEDKIMAVIRKYLKTPAPLTSVDKSHNLQMCCV